MSSDLIANCRSWIKERRAFDEARRQEEATPEHFNDKLTEFEWRHQNCNEQMEDLIREIAH